MRTLIDGYPLPDDDPDLDIQLRIDDYLSGPANEHSWGSTAGRVLNGTSTQEERYRWLMPLLRRAEWLLEHPEGARPHWALHLICAVELLLNHNRQQSEQELLALLGYSSVFRVTNMTGALDEIAPRAVEALRKTADKRLWVEALENACFELEQFEMVHGGRSAAQLGLALMIGPAAPASARLAGVRLWLRGCEKRPRRARDGARCLLWPTRDSCTLRSQRKNRSPRR